MHGWSGKRGRLVCVLLAGLVLIPASRALVAGGRGQTPDADECILGLMARHLLEDGEVRLFFYGQRYGLAIVESALAATSFALFGVGDAPLKWATLPLWMAGWVFFVLVMHRRAGWAGAVMAAALLIVWPAWTWWCMKPRGGYLTAFAAAHLAMWLADARADGRRALLGAGAIGWCLGLVFSAQPLWLPGLAPFIVPAALRLRLPAAMPVMGFCAAAAAAGTLYAGAAQGSGYWSPSVFSRPDLLVSLVDLPHRLWTHFCGTETTYVALPAGPIGEATATVLLAGAALAVVDLLFGRAIGASEDRRRMRRACAISLALTVTTTLLMTPVNFSGRYLLPVNAALVGWLACAGAELCERSAASRRTAFAGAALLIALCAGSMAELRRYRDSLVLPGNLRKSGEGVRSLVAELQRRDIQHVYCLDPLLQWHVMFESREAILARWTDPADRVPRYPQAVDAALYADQPVALVGPEEFRADLQAALSALDYGGRAPEPVNAEFFVLVDPSLELLTRLQFRFQEPR